MPAKKTTASSKPLVILNPSSGGGNVAERLGMLEREFTGCEIVVSESPEDLLWKTMAAAREKRPIYLSGGDGSLVLVLNALREGNLRTPILFLGTGSSNDIANHLGIKELPAALAALKKSPQAIDLGKVRASGQTGYFAGQVNLGLGALVNQYVEKKKTRYRWVYRLQNLVGAYAIWRAYRKKLVAFHAEIELTGADAFRYSTMPVGRNKFARVLGFQRKGKKLRFTGKFDILLAANIRYWAGGKEFIPGASVTDGELNLLAITSGSFWRMARIILAAGRGEMTEYISATHGVYLIPFTKMKVSLAKPGLVQLDGDLLEKVGSPLLCSSLDVQVVPGAADFYLSRC